MMGVISARDFVDLVMTHEEPNFAAVIGEYNEVLPLRWHPTEKPGHPV